MKRNTGKTGRKQNTAKSETNNLNQRKGSTSWAGRTSELERGTEMSHQLKGHEKNMKNGQRSDNGKRVKEHRRVISLILLKLRVLFH